MVSIADVLSSEKHQLQEMMSGLVCYQPTAADIGCYGDAGVAIIDQWLAAHAVYFVGMAESTFSLRIQEDRQLMGFSVRSTFNQLCGQRQDDLTAALGPAQWLLPAEDWDEQGGALSM